MSRNLTIISAIAALMFSSIDAPAQNLVSSRIDKWVTAEAAAAGTDLKAKDQAVATALRKAVEEACGVFLNAQSKSQDYHVVYDKIFANTVGYVREHKVIKTWIADEQYHAKVRAHVSTKKFEEDWATIAHTKDQEENPRVLVAIAESTHWSDTGPSPKIDQAGNIQAKIEDFFLDKGIILVDRETTEGVSKRDILLASFEDDTAGVIALGARFKADVIVTGQATAKYGNQFKVAGTTMYQYVASLRVRAVRTDSGQVIVAKSFGPITANTLQRRGGEEKALAKLAEEAAPKLLTAIVEAWRKQVHVARNIRLNISGMDYKGWKTFETEVEKIRGVQALRRREITAAVANIDVEYDYSTENLADTITALESVTLEVIEITANRIKLKVIE